MHQQSTQLPLDLEQWFPVVGWESWYEVSDHGRVRSIRSGRGTSYGRVLRPRRHRYGYLTVHLQAVPRYRPREFYIHALVAAAFLGARPGGLHINHKDGDKLNNRPNNLEYVTRSENILHGLRIGLQVPLCGTRNGGSKLTDRQVREIRRLKGKLSSSKIAAQFEITRENVWVIQSRKGWQHLA